MFQETNPNLTDSAQELYNAIMSRFGKTSFSEEEAKELDEWHAGSFKAIVRRGILEEGSGPDSYAIPLSTPLD